MLWRVRARLEDSQTGESMELKSREAAEDLCAVLERADSGELERLPADASPFRRYETSAISPPGVRSCNRANLHNPAGCGRFVGMQDLTRGVGCYLER
jgi:hypothetical protein